MRKAIPDDQDGEIISIVCASKKQSRWLDRNLLSVETTGSFSVLTFRGGRQSRRFTGKRVDLDDVFPEWQD